MALLHFVLYKLDETCRRKTTILFNELFIAYQLRNVYVALAFIKYRIYGSFGLVGELRNRGLDTG